ncbi:MAG: D-amino acid dehydrogenase [Burkholderiaceae bacterium]|jgi:D-amino-acid dehydrogenase|nr:D-amino acid dehydrogenase [Burkholderiaceae bacterium]
MRVIVIGAGVAGLTTARLLQREGLQVSVVDAADGPARGASRGNGAQLSYSYVAPLAEPSVVGKLPTLLADEDSPLKFHFHWDLAQWRWGLAFLRACTITQARATTQALLALSALSRELIERLVADERIDCAFAQSGKLVVYPDAASLATAQAQMQFQAQLGCVQSLLDRDQCIAREPALAGYAERIAGGIWTPSEAAADCGAFCDALAARLAKDGARFAWSRRALKVAADKGGARVLTDDGPLDADAVVLANGSEAAALGAASGLRLPVYPLKGYSITLDVPAGATMPACSITDTRRKVVFAPLVQGTRRRVRVAGFVELAGHDRSIPPARIDALVQATREVIGLAAVGDVAPWAGFRPATPTGLPLLGATPRKNLFVNVGQGALGWTLAGGSAQLVVDALLGRRSAIDARPFLYR